LILHHTRGIVFRSLKYSETSLIVKIYTEEFGLQSYLVKGAAGRKARLKPVFFQPLNLLDLVVYRKERLTLQTIREARFSVIYRSIPEDIRKSSMVLFLDEILNRAVGEEESNPDLFSYLWNSLELLDSTDQPVIHFHLLFLVKLSRYLGFFPRMNYSSSTPYFQLQEGLFVPGPDKGEGLLDQRLSALLARAMAHPMDHPHMAGLAARERDALLGALLDYYRYHIPGMHGIRSHEILHNALS
jgi:DNA repair protein RecO (recombination protein O)